MKTNCCSLAFAVLARCFKPLWPCLFSLLLTLFFHTSGRAQFETQLNVSPRPTALLSTWSNRPEIVNYLVTNQQGIRIPVKLRVTFKDAGGEAIGTTDFNLSASRIFATGFNLLTAKDVVQLQSLRFTGSTAQAINQTGRLPQGSYLLSVQIVEASTLAPLSVEQTRPFLVSSYQLPILMQPMQDQVLQPTIAQQVITFRWTPLSPQPTQQRISYQLQVWEVQDAQTPMQAFRSNQPLLNQAVVGVTQYIWQPRLHMGDSAQHRQFVWTIQTLDTDGLGINNGVGDGRSEPAWFSVGSLKNNGTTLKN
jgi:hypothetical protein